MFNRKQTYILLIVLFCMQMVVICLIGFRPVVDPPVYCLMVTGYTEERLKFARISLQNFRKQTYANKHLIILNQSKTTPLLKTDEDNVLEVYVSNEHKTLGELRNITLQLVPPNAIWTTWDDDDWRHEIYLSQMVRVMQRTGSDFLMFNNRIEYNLNNKFRFRMTMRSGFMTFFAKHNPNLRYEHKSVMEDVQVKQYALAHLKTYVYDNDARLYIRMIHTDNTSLYVNSKKTKTKDTHGNKVYFENELSQKEKTFVDNIISKYYKQKCTKSLKN